MVNDLSGFSTDLAGLGADLTARLRRAGLDPAATARVVATALAEDLVAGTDVTTAATIAAGTLATADLVARDEGVVAGLVVAEAVFVLTAACLSVGQGPPVRAAPSACATPRSPAGLVHLIARAHDGERVRSGQSLMSVHGDLAVMLAAERTALNLLSHLSGVATLTRSWVDAVAGTGAVIRDTRKTLPGLRALEKYAVRCGGGVNHRMSLADAVLIKDNHVAGAGSVAAAVRAAMAAAGSREPGGGREPAAVSREPGANPDGRGGLTVEVECDTLTQVEEAIEAGAELILLDNFGLAETRAAVAFAEGRVKLEASGGLSLDNAREVALTGVDYLAVGALTHSAPALDIGLDLVPGGVP